MHYHLEEEEAAAAFLELLEDDIVFRVQREQLARMDLMLLVNQALDIALLEEPSESQERSLAFHLTLERLIKNSVAGATAVETLKKAEYKTK